ncbi:MAG: hypothetical protein AVDCRST_MAG66-1004, partial [uncultured Pseudonocardia sp.]
ALVRRLRRRGARRGGPAVPRRLAAPGPGRDAGAGGPGDVAGRAARQPAGHGGRRPGPAAVGDDAGLPDVGGGLADRPVGPGARRAGRRDRRAPRTTAGASGRSGAGE